jgi:AmiR/NasT family two-component response regulator
MITGRDDPGLSERVLASGAAAYLRKPLDEQALLAAITSAVPERGAGEERASENLETAGAVLANEPLVNGEIK